MKNRFSTFKNRYISAPTPRLIPAKNGLEGDTLCFTFSVSFKRLSCFFDMD